MTFKTFFREKKDLVKGKFRDGMCELKDSVYDYRLSNLKKIRTDYRARNAFFDRQLGIPKKVMLGTAVTLAATEAVILPAGVISYSFKNSEKFTNALDKTFRDFWVSISNYGAILADHPWMTVTVIGAYVALNRVQGLFHSYHKRDEKNIDPPKRDAREIVSILSEAPKGMLNWAAGTAVRAIPILVVADICKYVRDNQILAALKNAGQDVWNAVGNAATWAYDHPVAVFLATAAYFGAKAFGRMWNRWTNEKNREKAPGS